MSQQYEVTRVMSEGPWEDMETYSLDLQDMAGQQKFLNCARYCKITNGSHKEPQEGETFFADLLPMKDPNRKKVKVDYEATKELHRGGHREASTGSSGGSQNVSKGQGGGETNWTERNAEIRRQHSQQVALEALAQIDEHAMHPAALKDLLREWADWFDQDAIDAGQKASQGAGAGADEGHSPGPSSALRESAPPPEQSPADDTAQWLENLLVQGGASTHAAGILARYATEELSPENLKKCEGLLSDLDTQGEGRKRLEASYEKAKGPVPQLDPNEEPLPF